MDRKDRVFQLVAPGLLVAMVASGVARGQETTRASVDSSGVEGDGDSGAASLSADGRFVAFSSAADNLVPFDTNGFTDVFVRDVKTGATERVSVSSAGVEADESSESPSISADGRFVAFVSGADNLVAGDTNNCTDIFVFDRKTATTWRASVDSSGNQGNSGSDHPSISADGRFVAFESSALNWVAGKTQLFPDIFVHDNVNGTTDQASVDSSGVTSDARNWHPHLSADGDRVVFASLADNLVPGDTNLKFDAFMHERSSGSTVRIDIAWNGAEANDDCYYATISADGTTAAFESLATNLVKNDLNGSVDAFVVDLASGSIERVSVDSSGGEGDAGGGSPALSGEGRYVAFSSDSDNLAAGDTNARSDIYVHDRRTGTTWRASVASDLTEGDGPSTKPWISVGGHAVGFESGATNLVPGDGNGFSDVFLRREPDAAWTNYGAGYPGTLGVPALTAEEAPTLGTTLTLDLGNSAGVFTYGLLLVGFDRANLSTTAGGTLLVDPTLILLVPVPDAGTTLSGALPDDETLSGLLVDLQLLESDAGASRKLSFSRGLELRLGR